MTQTRVLVARVNTRIQIPEKEPDEAIRTLEKQAMNDPEARSDVTSVLNDYAYRYKGTEGAKTAQRAVTRIAAVTMLEALCEEEPV